mmetsp:Transcript_14082/g.23368  ORF Transcript_14082/g.23368 Transcript_14082/m.23368 type:complete len:134 (-) Transcript_14082:202-603(-)
MRVVMLLLLHCENVSGLDWIHAARLVESGQTPSNEEILALRDISVAQLAMAGFDSLRPFILLSAQQLGSSTAQQLRSALVQDVGFRALKATNSGRATFNNRTGTRRTALQLSSCFELAKVLELTDHMETVVLS